METVMKKQGKRERGRRVLREIFWSREREIGGCG